MLGTYQIGPSFLNQLFQNQSPVVPSIQNSDVVAGISRGLMEYSRTMDLMQAMRIALKQTILSAFGRTTSQMIPQLNLGGFQVPSRYLSTAISAVALDVMMKEKNIPYDVVATILSRILGEMLVVSRDVIQ